MKFISQTGVEFIFLHGADYPVSAPLEKIQALDRAESGKTEVEQLGPSIATRTIAFGKMCQTDYLGLKNWFDTIANGAVNSFTFEDELGVTGQVIIISNVYDFVEIRHEVYAGNLILEYV